ncbi:hypothetical protein EZ456_01665 [Pedobacter psychrodurus]|uniref:Lipoprotein n=1 Tax=Pedobacter psychrodurus TaxID=2530456 RepID=A0A4R0Q372_9SPHI|nr:hypothetical protein [Pedobacter psychrodurus]TCD29753.1 hypothetical protein EZ456_01665 [Pedobacter psychrodurus]
MKTKLKSTILLSLILTTSTIFSCTKKNDESKQLMDKISSYKSSISVKALVEKKSFIDVDFAKIAPIKLRSNKTEKEMREQELEMAKAKAAVYRFYSHVKLINGLYKVEIENGKSINISENSFIFIENNLKANNDWIEKEKAAGKIVDTPPVTSEYLNALIKN